MGVALAVAMLHSSVLNSTVDLSVGLLLLSYGF